MTMVPGRTSTNGGSGANADAYMPVDPSIRKDSERTRTPKAVFVYFGSSTPVEPAEVTTARCPQSLVFAMYRQTILWY